MSDARFHVIFQGQMVSGANPDAVRANFARLFRLDNPAKVEAYFSGRRVVLKKDVDQAAAMKLRATLKQAGVLCELEPVSGVVPSAAPGAPASMPTEAPAASGTTGHEMVGTIRVGGEGFSGPFQVAPPGAVLHEAAPAQDVRVPDVSTIQLAPVGSDMGEVREQKPPVNPDISHLALE